MAKSKTEKKTKKKQSKKKKPETEKKKQEKAKQAQMDEKTDEDLLEDDVEEKADRTDIYLIAGVIILLLAFGGIIFWINTAPKETEVEPTFRDFNGFLFEKEGDKWKTLLTMENRMTGAKQNYEVYFHYTPEEVDYIPTMRNSRNETISPNLFLNAKEIYITMDPEYPSEVVLSGVEISKVIGTLYKKEVKGATTRDYEGLDAPTITCDDIGPDVRVIQLYLGNSTRIYSDKGCIIVEGENPDTMLKAAERLAFEMLKIL